MSYNELDIHFTPEYYKILELYNNIDISKDVHTHDIGYFNTFTGDITKNIKWSWAGNSKSINYFKQFFDSIQLFTHLTTFYGEDFYIRGASFISLYEDNVTDTHFHFDAMSQYDETTTTNIITIIFPIYIDNTMGNLEYYDSDNEDENDTINKLYKYKKNKLIIWDSCKFSHRTEPYKLDEKKLRVLVSVNLSTDKEWAVNTINNCLESQGNKYIIN